jgi:hypothetical protein
LKLAEVKVMFAERNENAITHSDKSPEKKYDHQSAQRPVISRLYFTGSEFWFW